MHKFWGKIIKPIISSIDANYIVEIGSDTGTNTENILEYCVNNDAHMTAIDPSPKFDTHEFKAKYGDKFEIYFELSLSRLPLLNDYDVILIDGDHNWYTVYNELKIIEKNFKNKKFPLVFLHDVGWPYGRRDLYYNPENIPEVYRHPYKKLGMHPDQTDLKEQGGLNSNLYNSIYENNSKNGVLTAIEDFIEESDSKFSFEFIDAFHGLGILFPENQSIMNIIKETVEKADFSNILEKERIKLVIVNYKSSSQNKELVENLNETKITLENVQNLLNKTEGLLKVSEELVKKKNISMEETKNLLIQTQNNLKNTEERAKQKDTQLTNTQKQLTQTQNNLKTAKKQAKQKDTQLTNTQKQLTQTQNNLKNTEERAKQKDTQLTNTQKQLTQTQNNLKNTEERAKQKDISLEETKNLLIQTQNSLESIQNGLKSTENNLKSTEKLVKKKENELGVLYEKTSFIIENQEKLIEELNQQINDLKTTRIYETNYIQNKGRPLIHRLISNFPSLYILSNVKKTGLKNAIINIKGYNAIKKNNTFDMGYYLKNYEDVRASGVDPILHYMYHGFQEGRKIDPTFDSDYYLKTNKDVEYSKINPLVHYSLYGIKEGRKPYNDLKTMKKDSFLEITSLQNPSAPPDTTLNIKNLSNPPDTTLNKKHAEELYKEILNKNNSLIHLHSFKEDSPLTSIIIINRNGLEHLKRLFKDLKENIQYSCYEIIIVDNASTDGSLDFLENLSNDLPIKIIKNNENVSFSKANNQGAEIAEGEYLLLLNNDVEPLYGWFNQMMQTALSSEDIGAVGAKLVYPNVSESVYNKSNSFKIQHAGIAFNQKDDIFYPYNIGRRLNPFDPSINFEKRVAGVTAAALLVRKDVYWEVGGFDEDYYYGYEDVDFCLKLLKDGYKNVYCPEALLFHYEHGTDETDETERRERRRIANENIFISKWNEWLHKQFLLDKIENKKLFSEKPLKVALTVTEKGQNASAGDYFTALEFSEALKKIGYDVSLLPQNGPEDWYEVGGDVDVLISLLDSYRPYEVKCSNNSLIKIAWPRNWFDKWIYHSQLQSYDIILASSKTACKYIKNKTGLNPALMPIGTNPNRFNNVGYINKDYSCDYCFTGSYWYDPREIMEMLNPESMPYTFKLYGKNWENVEEFKDYYCGFVSYEKLPEVYNSTKIVIDDANRVTKDFGSVNSRVYDAISSGALVLTNGELGSKETFKGKLPVYRSKQELQDLIRYYLTNEDARLKKIRQLKEFVLENHTYDHRALHLKDILKDHVSKGNVLLKTNFVTDPLVTIPYLESVNPIKSDCLKVAVFIEGELKSLKSCPYLRLYSPLKHLSLKEKFKIFIYDRDDFADVDVNKIINCKLFDAIIIQRGTFDIKNAEIILEKCKKHNIKVIYEFDDDLLSISENNRNYPFFKSRIESMDYLIKNSDLLTVTTDALYERFKEINDISIVRNYMVDELNPMKRVKLKDNSDSVDIGYFGTLTHDEDLLMIEEPICNVIQKFEEEYNIRVNFHIVGGMNEEHDESWYTKVEIPDDCTDFLPFLSWIKSDLKFDIMIAPLKDTTFNHAKSELKYIEYTALGIPGIYSDLPPYNSAVEDGVNGMIAKNEEEWEGKLEKLILDQDLRIKIVENAQKDIQENYLVEHIAEQWGNILNRIILKENPHRPQISIVLPIYNMEKYLRKTLESIEQQTIGLENLEVLMINEASSDGSKLIIDEYENKYENFIAVHLPKSSGTPGKPRNLGMDMASGEYIMFIDHDDFYSDDACEVLYNKISKEDVDIVSGIYNFIHESEIVESNDKRIFENGNEIKIKNISEKEELLTLAPVVWSKIFRKSFIKDNSLRFPVGVLAEDLIFLSTALLKANGIIFLNYPVYNYRVRDQDGDTSLSQSRDKKWFKGVCDARKIIWDTYQREGKEIYFKQICEYSSHFLLDVFTLSNLKPKDKYDVLNYMYWILEKSNEYGISPPVRYENLFKSIIEKDYDNAIIIAESIEI